jgi:hypothetical protein
VTVIASLRVSLYMFCDTYVMWMVHGYDCTLRLPYCVYDWMGWGLSMFASLTGLGLSV